MNKTYKGFVKYNNGILTIITGNTMYDFCLDPVEYGYCNLGDYWYWGGLVTTEDLEKLKADCKKYYVFDLNSLEVVERRETK